jgi:hypothetical protein
MQRLRLDYMVGCLLNAVDQVVVPGERRSNVAGVPGAGLRQRWLCAVFQFQKIFNSEFQTLSANAGPEQLSVRTQGCVDLSHARARRRSEREERSRKFVRPRTGRLLRGGARVEPGFSLGEHIANRYAVRRE